MRSDPSNLKSGGCSYTTIRGVPKGAAEPCLWDFQAILTAADIMIFWEVPPDPGDLPEKGSSS